ncbi:RNA polymerase III transcription factor IIIC subunit-domain-containing protein [Chytridium lagenaria]|nr:RNA polymerase III transcription factor IIIC subunit-domain-containing protein [Chytridium lagenaria]
MLHQHEDEHDLSSSVPLPNWNFHAFGEDLGHIELRYPNVLLKVTTKRRKKKAGESVSTDAGADPKISTEIVGIAVADFQVLANLEDPMVMIRKKIAEYDIPAIDDFEYPEKSSEPSAFRSFPPPLFSRVEWPLNYGYREKSQPFAIPGSKRLKFIHHKVGRDDKVIPESPPEEVIRNSGNVSEESLVRLRQLFAERPVWTRLALCNNLPRADVDNFRKLIPFVAYAMMWGPWKDSWIRYGYDPRSDRDARLYQVIYMHSIKKPQAVNRGKRHIGIEDSSQLLTGRMRSHRQIEEPDGDQDAGDQKTSHIFDGKTWRGLASMQLCDITDPDVTMIIQSGKGVRKSPDDKDGWFETEFLLHMREVVRNKIFQQSGREGKEMRYQIPLDNDDDQDAEDNQDGEDDDNMAQPDSLTLEENDVGSNVQARVSSYFPSLRLFTLKSFNISADDDDE